MKTLIVIPARLGSTRLPGKMLLRETGRTLIEHTYQAVRKCASAHDVIVATDDDSIRKEVEKFGGRVCMTRVDHRSGTDRVAEVAERFPEYPLIVNVQGDEPELESDAVNEAIRLLREREEAAMSTVAVPIENRALLDDPACVKVVLDSQQRALYFSRSCIPFVRDPASQDASGAGHLQHVGIYVYRRDFLLNFPRLPVSMLERAESLEQLRALENGFTILVARGLRAAKGIDTIEDYRAFVRRQMNC